MSLVRFKAPKWIVLRHFGSRCFPGKSMPAKKSALITYMLTMLVV